MSCVKKKYPTISSNKTFPIHSFLFKISISIASQKCHIYVILRQALLSCPGRLKEDETNRKNFACALGNLSTANFEDKSYFESKANADVLLKCCGESLNIEKISKFTNRSEQCADFLGAQGSGYTVRPLPTWDSDKFSITYEETVGRNGVAMTDINFGDILLIDKPIVMRNKVGKKFCMHCLASLQRTQVYKSPFCGEVWFITCQIGIGMDMSFFCPGCLLFVGLPGDCYEYLSCI